jgi:hypothetical protein
MRMRYVSGERSVTQRYPDKGVVPLYDPPRYTVAPPGLLVILMVAYFCLEVRMRRVNLDILVLVAVFLEPEIFLILFGFCRARRRLQSRSDRCRC